MPCTKVVVLGCQFFCRCMKVENMGRSRVNGLLDQSLHATQSPLLVSKIVHEASVKRVVKLQVPIDAKGWLADGNGPRESGGIELRGCGHEHDISCLKVFDDRSHGGGKRLDSSGTAALGVP